MTAADGPAAWHEVASHLVHDHLADAGEFLRCAPDMAELHEAHDCAHSYPGSFPPVRHEHSAQLPAGDPDYTPFAPAADPRGDFAPWPFPNPHVPGECEWVAGHQASGGVEAGQ
jgi:hypothetical protein